MTAPLIAAAQTDRRLRDELLLRWPSLAEDEPALWDTLEGCSDGSFEMQIGIAIRMVDEARALVAGIAMRQEELAERKGRLQEREAAIRRAIMAAMDTAGRTKITLPEATLSLAKTAPAVVVPEEDQVGPGPWWVAPPLKLSRFVLKEHLDAGEVVKGARLGNGGAQLQIRRK